MKICAINNQNYKMKNEHIFYNLKKVEHFLILRILYLNEKHIFISCVTSF